MNWTSQNGMAGFFKMDGECSLKMGDKQSPSMKEGAYICNTDILKE
ncbi:hypothetical protein OCO53_08395 [Peribacillus frigoritolerans]|nr:hypothetical protein [Peribacillus frigoritolerans]MCU6600480.1 hypothetical protein [Peribacillus frigoritolerans]